MAAAALTRMPVVYISHGSPMSGFKLDDASEFWKKLGSQISKLPGLRGVLVLLKSNKIGVQGDDSHGLDHGTWVPLKWMFPSAELPVVQLSLAAGGSMQEHVDVGKALKALRDEGVLIMGSGSAVHNLREAGRYFSSRTLADFVVPFDKDLESIVAGSTDAAREQRMIGLEQHPLLRQAHPTLEHLLPMHVAVGAAGSDAGAKLFSKVEFSFSEAAYGFGTGVLQL
eukprot:jgi/Mesen1/10472/ME000083S09977